MKADKPCPRTTAYTAVYTASTTDQLKPAGTANMFQSAAAPLNFSAYAQCWADHRTHIVPPIQCIINIGLVFFAGQHPHITAEAQRRQLQPGCENVCWNSAVHG